MNEEMKAVVDQVKDLGSRLVEAGWLVANAVGELRTPDSRIWMSATYMTGEYTVHAFLRPRGFGVPVGNIRVRITPGLARHHPSMGTALADDLIRASNEVGVLGSTDLIGWPPPIWSELSVNGVVDLR